MFDNLRYLSRNIQSDRYGTWVSEQEDVPLVNFWRFCTPDVSLTKEGVSLEIVYNVTNTHAGDIYKVV